MSRISELYSNTFVTASILICGSASPLNGEAALLWDRDQVEYKKKVLARHLEPAELENGA